MDCTCREGYQVLRKIYYREEGARSGEYRSRRWTAIGMTCLTCGTTRIDAHPTSSIQTDNPFHQLFHRTPPQLRHSLYRTLALLLHPDRLGDLELMKQLNLQWESMTTQT